MKKIVLISNNNLDSFGFHLSNSFKNSNNKVILIDYYKYKTKILRFLMRVIPFKYNIIAKSQIKNIIKLNPDFVITTYKDIKSEYWNKLKANGIYIVSINPDHMGTLGNQHILASIFDLYLVKCRTMYSQLKNKSELNVVLYNEAVDLSIMKLNNQVTKKWDITFIGSMYPYRLLFINSFLKHLKKSHKIRFFGDYHSTTDQMLKNLNLDINIEPPIFLEKKNEIINESKVVINLMHINEIDSSNAKFPEIMATGTMQLIDFNTHLAKEMDQSFLDLFCFSSSEECSIKTEKIIENYTTYNNLWSSYLINYSEKNSYSKLVNVILNNIKL